MKKENRGRRKKTVGKAKYKLLYLNKFHLIIVLSYIFYLIIF
jgi:hypothetical protein